MATETLIKSCSTTACSYNREGCTAPAVTIGGDAGAATCATFIALDARGGLATTGGRVGACQRLECVHNTDLMCKAEAVTVGGDSATCELYAAG